MFVYCKYKAQQLSGMTTWKMQKVVKLGQEDALWTYHNWTDKQGSNFQTDAGTEVLDEQGELSEGLAAPGLDSSGKDGIADDDCWGEDVERGDAGAGHDDGLVPGHNEQGEQDGEHTASHHLQNK